MTDYSVDFQVYLLHHNKSSFLSDLEASDTSLTLFTENDFFNAHSPSENWDTLCLLGPGAVDLHLIACSTTEATV